MIPAKLQYQPHCYRCQHLTASQGLGEGEKQGSTFYRARLICNGFIYVTSQYRVIQGSFNSLKVRAVVQRVTMEQTRIHETRHETPDIGTLRLRHIN